MASEASPLVTFRRDAPIVIGTASPESMQDLASMKRFGDQVVGIVKKHPGLNLMLSFEKVEYLSSAALTELIRINDLLTEEKGHFSLCGLSPDMYKVFEITKLDKLFGLNWDEDVATSIQRFKLAVSTGGDGQPRGDWV